MPAEKLPVEGLGNECNAGIGVVVLSGIAGRPAVEKQKPRALFSFDEADKYFLQLGMVTLIIA